MLLEEGSCIKPPKVYFRLEQTDACVETHLTREAVDGAVTLCRMLLLLQVVQMDLLYLRQLQVLNLSVMFGASQLANPFAFVHKLHNVLCSDSNSVAPLLAIYKQQVTLNSLIRSVAGLTLGETPALS